MKKIRVTIIMDVGDVPDNLLDTAVAHHARTLAGSLGAFNMTSSWGPDARRRRRRITKTVPAATILKGTRWA